MKCLVRSAVATLMLASTLSAANAADEINPALSKNAEILRTIMQTTFKDDKNTPVSQLSYGYLAGQGLLFQANINRGFRHIITMGGKTSLSMPPVPPVPPVNIDGSTSVTIDTSEIENWAEQVRDMMADQQRDQYHQIKDLQQKRMQLERQLYDIERDKRNIEFNRQLTEISKDEQKELQQLNQQQQQTRQQLDKITAEADKAKADLEKQQAAEVAEAARQTTEMISRVGEQFSAMLCDYGASLRELPDNEHVSLQLTNLSRSPEKYYWVVKKSDINQCITGKTNPKGLQAKIRHYKF